MNLPVDWLRRDPLTYAVLSLNRKYGLAMDPYTVSISDPVPVDETGLTSVLVSGIEPPEWSCRSWSGSVRLEYRRLPLSSVFGESICPDIDLPATVEDIVSSIERRSGVIVGYSDVRQGIIRGYDIHLEALSGSLKWVGQVSIADPLPRKLRLNELIQTRDLNGFAYTRPD